MGLADLPTLAEMQQTRRAVPKHAMTPHVVTKHEKAKTKLQREAAFRAGVWDRDRAKSRASGRPLVKSGTDWHRVGEVHHMLARSTNPDRVLDVSNGILLSKDEHQLAETACPGDPSRRLLDILGPEDRGKDQVFVWRKPNGSETKRRIG